MSVYPIVETTDIRLNAGMYFVCKEIIDDSEWGGDGKLPMTMAYNLEGEWIGNSREAKHLCRDRGIYPTKSKLSHCVCSIGFCEKEQKWYGWSHRAICGFGVGDRIFESNYGNDNTPFVKHGKKKIKTISDAKMAAKRFSAYVS